MTDNGPMMSRVLPVDAHTATVPRDGGLETARMLRLMALLGIAARLFFIYASANQISVSHTLLGLGTVNGKIDLTGQPDGGSGLVSRAHEADSLVTEALAVSIIVMILFVLSSLSLLRRRKRGDPLAAAVDKHRANRIASRLYVVAAIASGAAMNGFKPGPDASPTDRLHAVADIAVANIGIQILVISFLLIVALATGREIDKARAAGRIG